MDKQHYSVVIVGGGVVGALTAYALSKNKDNILLIDKSPLLTNQAANKFDEKTFALNLATEKFLRELDIWQDLEPDIVKINQVKVNVKSSYGSSNLQNKNQQSLGFVISPNFLKEVLYKKLLQENKVKLLFEAEVKSYTQKHSCNQIVLNSNQKINAQLVIDATGGKSILSANHSIVFQEYDYGHSALITNLKLSKGHNNIALERFLANGAIALLPWRDNFSTCVWTMSHEKKSVITALDKGDILAKIQENIGYDFGKILDSSSIFNIKLNMVTPSSIIGHRFLLLGGASLKLHPIAAQGLNLTVRDIANLCSMTQTNQTNDLGQNDILQKFAQEQSIVKSKVGFATNFLANYIASNKINQKLKALGITMFDCLLPARSFFANRSQGFW